MNESALNKLLLDSLPHAAMLIRKDRTVIAQNRIAEEAGVKIGGYCWEEFGKRLCLSKENLITNDAPLDKQSTYCRIFSGICVGLYYG
jgi:hypothetical protein